MFPDVTVTQPPRIFTSCCLADPAIEVTRQQKPAVTYRTSRGAGHHNAATDTIEPSLAPGP